MYTYVYISLSLSIYIYIYIHTQDPFVGATPLIDGQENRGVPAGQPAAKSLGKVDLILDDDLVLEEEGPLILSLHALL